MGGAKLGAIPIPFELRMRKQKFGYGCLRIVMPP